MSNPSPDYPRPVADDDNKTFIEGWAEGRLMLQSCAGCGRVFFYPRPLCPHCWSADFTWRPSQGTGTVLSFSLVHRPNHPVFFDEAPIALAEVRLAEGVPLIARIVGGDPAALRSGMAVELLPLPEARRYPLPTFRPRQG